MARRRRIPGRPGPLPVRDPKHAHVRGVVRYIVETPPDERWSLEHYLGMVVAVAERVEAALGPREVCEACGCLCLPLETCPGCLSRLPPDPYRREPVPVS